MFHSESMNRTFFCTKYKY